MQLILIKNILRNLHNNMNIETTDLFNTQKPKGFSKLQEARYFHKLSNTPCGARSSFSKSLLQSTCLPDEMQNLLKIDELWQTIKHDSACSLSSARKSFQTNDFLKYANTIDNTTPSKSKQLIENKNRSTSSLFNVRKSLQEGNFKLNAIEEKSGKSKFSLHKKEVELTYEEHYATTLKTEFAIKAHPKSVKNIRTVTPNTVSGNSKKTKTLLEHGIELTKINDSTKKFQQKVWKAMNEYKKTAQITKTFETKNSYSLVKKPINSKIYSTTTGNRKKSYSTTKTQVNFKPKIEPVIKKERSSITPNKTMYDAKKNDKLLFKTHYNNDPKTVSNISPFRKKNSMNNHTPNKLLKSKESPKFGKKDVSPVNKTPVHAKSKTPINSISPTRASIKRENKDTKEATIKKLMNRININSVITKLAKKIPHKI